MSRMENEELMDTASSKRRELADDEVAGSSATAAEQDLSLFLPDRVFYDHLVSKKRIRHPTVDRNRQRTRAEDPATIIPACRESPRGNLHSGPETAYKETRSQGKRNTDNVTQNASRETPSQGNRYLRTEPASTIMTRKTHNNLYFDVNTSLPSGLSLLASAIPEKDIHEVDHEEHVVEEFTTRPEFLDGSQDRCPGNLSLKRR